MQVRNLLIAAGAALAATTAIAAVPATASAQGFYHPYRAERVREFHRFEARRHWEHRRFEAWRFHHRPFYRGY